MNKKDKIYILIISGLCLLAYLFLYRPLSEYDQYDIENTKQEERIKQLEEKLLEKDSLYNEVKKERDSVKFQIDNRKDNIKIITQKYDKEILSINKFNADESIKYFSKWINE
ncbi:hypothetical protein COB55_03830 [Candidatus Wolfebacteria bacterium]|nr:MAG: hypothetical protein COB55_03830 [Candidatus Wolfebacteria bacterium]